MGWSGKYSTGGAKCYIFPTSSVIFYHTAQVYSAFTDLLGNIMRRIISAFTKNSQHDALGDGDCYLTHHEAFNVRNEWISWNR